MAFKRLAPAAPTAAPSATAVLVDKLAAEAAKMTAASPPPAVSVPTPVPMTVIPRPAAEVSIGAFGIAASKPVGLSSMVAVAKGGGGAPQPFPVIQLMGGGTGGAFAIAAFVPAELHASLPQGRVNIPAMYLGSRYELQAWPKGYDDREGEKERPSWTCAIPITDGANVALMTEACKKYNYMKKDDKAKFDFDASGVGHIRPVFQALVFLQQFGGLCIVQAPAHFNSAEQSSESLSAHIDAGTGALNPFPCTIRPVTTAQSNKAGTQTWKVHHLDFHGEPNPTGAAVVKDFQTWYAEAKLDTELIAAFTEWTTCVDDLIDADGIAALTKGKHL